MLVVNLGGIGDALLSTPALRALKGAYPDATISVLTGRSASEVFGGLDYIKEVIVIPLNYRGGLSLGALLGEAGLLAGLRSRRFDLAINMRTLYSPAGALKMRVLLAAIGARITAGRDTDGRGKFFDIKIGETNRAQMYERDYDIELVRRLGAQVSDTRIDLTITADDRASAGGLLEGAGISPGDILVGIHPGGKPSRRLQPERFSTVATVLRRRAGCRFVVTGDASERALADRIIRMSGITMLNAAGRLGIGATAALIERCSLYISNDTANMHIAAILRTPLVAIFGPGNLTRFDPRRISDRAVVIYHAAPCAPCENMVCARMDCLKAVSASEVADAALSLLGAGE
jgi:heptosyltransferase-2